MDNDFGLRRISEFRVYVGFVGKMMVMGEVNLYGGVRGKIKV